MNRSRSDDPVLTGYVRERLDQRMGKTGVRPGDAEARLRTIVRARPVLTSESVSASDEVDAAEPLVRESGGRTSRVSFTRHHLMVVAMVLALGALIAGYALTRARAVPVAAPVVVESEGPASASGPMSPSAPTPTTPPVRVHVMGEVRQPGVYTLPQGARVVDALEVAGGLTSLAKPGPLNLAQVLVDGQQVMVGDARQHSEVRGTDSGAAAPGGGAGPAAGKMNLNTATPAQLDSLPGVGPVTAEKIIAWRTQHGRFTRIEELQEVPGIGPKSFAEIAPHVAV